MSGCQPSTSQALGATLSRRQVGALGSLSGGRRGRVQNLRGGTSTIPGRRSSLRRPNPGERALDRAGALRLGDTEHLGPFLPQEPRVPPRRLRRGGGARGAGRPEAGDGRRGGGAGARRGGWVRRGERAGGRPPRARKAGAGVGPRRGHPSARPRLPGSAGPQHHRRRRLTQRPRPAVPGPTRRRRRRPRPESPSAAPLAAPARAAPAARPAAPPAVPEEAAPPVARSQRPAPAGPGARCAGLRAAEPGGGPRAAQDPRSERLHSPAALGRPAGPREQPRGVSNHPTSVSAFLKRRCPRWRTAASSRGRRRSRKPRPQLPAPIQAPAASPVLCSPSPGRGSSPGSRPFCSGLSPISLG